MADAFSSIEYPHWLIVAGSLLLMLGFFGLALRQRGVEADPSDQAIAQEPSEPEAVLTQEEVYERTAKEKRRARWAEESAASSSEESAASSSSGTNL